MNLFSFCLHLTEELKTKKTQNRTVTYLLVLAVLKIAASSGALMVVSWDIHLPKRLIDVPGSN